MCLTDLKGNVQWFPKDEHDEPFISIGWGWEGQTVRPKIEAVGKITMSYTKGQEVSEKQVISKL